MQSNNCASSSVKGTHSTAGATAADTHTLGPGPSKGPVREKGKGDCREIFLEATF